MAVTAVLYAMLERVAEALGDELREQMIFVGGCTTGLLLTDEFTKEQVRNTDDVDLIVGAMSYIEFTQLQDKLRERGFTDHDPQSCGGSVICAMYLGELRVDFMPSTEKVLGFSNRWYPQAMESASIYQLRDDLEIKLITPVFFLATKIEAYKGRGNNDPLSSRDIEDILNLIDGREELVNDFGAASPEVQRYISDELSQLEEHPDFEYAVQSQAANNSDREQVIFERLETLILKGSDDE